MEPQDLHIAGMNEGRRPEQPALPSHVEHYKEILFRHNALAEKRRRAPAENEEMKTIAQQLQEYVQALPLEQQRDIEHFVLQVTHGKMVSDEASKTHGRFVRTMHWFPRTMKLAADVFPPLCKETTRLAFSSAGLALVGIGHAAKDTWNAVRDVFFSQSA